MEFYKVVAKIKYKENVFYVMINRACQKYFMKELADGSVIYPTLQEFKELYEIFNQKQALAAFKIGRDYQINPKLIAKGKKFAAVGLAVAVIGASVPGLVDRFRLPKNVIERQSEEEKETLEDFYRKAGYDFRSLAGYEDERMYRLHEYVISKEELRVIECQDFDEFARLMEIQSKPTYSEVWNTLLNNNEIDEKYKMWLLEGMENLEKKLPNMDLTVLNYNLKRLKLKAATDEEINRNKNLGERVGRFDAETGAAYFVDTEDDMFNKFVVLHEVLGHGISEAVVTRPAKDSFKMDESFDWTIHVSKEKIIVSDSIFVMKCFDEAKENGRDYDFFYVGQGFEEGKADLIAKFAMGDLMVLGSSYLEQSEELRIMCEACGLSLEEYISNGGAEILSQKMQENDVENSLSYIYASDIYTNAQKSGLVEVLDTNVGFKENITAFFKDYADNKMKNGADKKEIIEKFAKIVLASGEYTHYAFSNEKVMDYAKFIKENLIETVQVIDDSAQGEERE